MIHWLLQTRQGVVLAIVLLVVLALLFYLLPSLLGLVMGVIHWRGVLLVNVLLGWTVIGWLASLVWVLLDRVRDPDRETWPAATEDEGA